MNLGKFAANRKFWGESLISLQIHIPPATLEIPHTAVVCSRLGNQRRLHRHVGQQLVQSAMRCRSLGERWLVANGSAIEPWAIRAAELFDVPITTLGINQPADIVIATDIPMSCDAAVIELADRVEAAYVRNRGAIEASLKDRLRSHRHTSTHVAIAPAARCAAKKLFRLGAVGQFRWPPDQPDSPPGKTHAVANEPWTQTNGIWLIHCTRGQPSNWPGETIRQYRDTVLLGQARSDHRGPLETLIRILRSGRLIATARTSNRKYPVVCFSSLPLQTLLSKRCFRSHVCRWDYEPFGIAIRLQVARRIGIQPVIYGPPSQRNELAEAEQFRFHPIGKTFAWQQEQEWRSPHTIDLKMFKHQDVRIFAAVPSSSQNPPLPPIPWRVTYAPNHGKKNHSALSSDAQQQVCQDADKTDR